MLNFLRKSTAHRQLVRDLFAALTRQARQPVFFRELGVADTVDGRFDMVALHAWLVLDRLKAAGMHDEAKQLADTIFTGFDEGLRDLGNGDMGMGRRMKKIGDAFAGRMSAYDAAADLPAMAEAVLRNVYRGEAGHEQQARVLATYALAARTHLGLCDPATGKLDFGAIETTYA
ncbi:MAG: ubiquinol-cytochrome C chaperone [Alphaproteobacteria bacterium]|nr:ubiquinol-cytochrome C chaperone [Alphaproteobacteria bacterium]